MKRTPGTLLFISQGFYWIQTRSSNSGKHPKGESHSESDHKSKRDGDLRDLDLDSWQEEVNRIGHCQAQQDSDNSATAAEYQSFGQEFYEQHLSIGSHCFLYADFASSLSDCDEHDIHDADPASDQGNGSNDKEHEGKPQTDPIGSL